MSAAARFVQSPTATLDYLIDWSDYLTSPPADVFLAPGVTDTLLTSTFTADTGLTIIDAGHTATYSRVWVTAAGASSLGGSFNVVNTITTAGGRTDERTLTFLIREL